MPPVKPPCQEFDFLILTELVPVEVDGIEIFKELKTRFNFKQIASYSYDEDQKATVIYTDGYKTFIKESVELLDSVIHPLLIEEINEVPE